MSDVDLLVNLAVAIGVAAFGAIVAVRLNQSVILGYILAGIVIGPYTPGFVGNPEAVEALANIGVILLMFTIGVQLSIRELLQSGRVAILGGGAQVLLMIGVGYLVGRALGWEGIEGLFFGAVVSNSSSTVLGKVLSERGDNDTIHGRIGLAWSTVQDVSTIILVVVLSALATGEGDVFSDLLWATGKATLFLVLLLPVGFKVLPRLFERVAALRSREIFVLIVAAFALGTAYLSSVFGLSLALGAFVAGVVVSESDIWHQILGEIVPMRDIFAGLFFVSVGILVDPSFILRNPLLVLLMIFMIVVVKGLMCIGIMALFRYSVRTAVLTGVILAQSAEFSFLMARVGADIDAVRPAIFNMMLAGTAASIVLAPALYSWALPAARRIELRLPESTLARDERLEPGPPLIRGHAVICGYGRVGQVIGEALNRRGFPFVVIEQDQDIVRGLREKGLIVLLGSADNLVLLARTRLEEARILVVAVPDPLAARRIVDYAREVNPQIDVVVRTHSQAERAFLYDHGVSEAVMAELEMALEMTRFTLRRFGVSMTEIQSILQRIRTRDPGHDPLASLLSHDKWRT